MLTGYAVTKVLALISNFGCGYVFVQGIFKILKNQPTKKLPQNFAVICLHSIQMSWNASLMWHWNLELWNPGIPKDVIGYSENDMRTS